MRVWLCGCLSTWAVLGFAGTVAAHPRHSSGLYAAGKLGAGICWRRGYVLGIGVNVVQADLSDPRVRVGALVSRRGIGTVEGFRHMVWRAQPAAAITGTFFGLGNLLPTGDVVSEGRTLFRGFIG